MLQYAFLSLYWLSNLAKHSNVSRTVGKALDTVNLLKRICCVKILLCDATALNNPGVDSCDF
jgi:hypothetical protein